MSEELSEIKALLQHQIQASEARGRESAKESAATQGQLTEIRTTMAGLGTKVLEIDRRLQKNEQATKEASDVARKALNSQADLEGSLLAEVGALAANDRRQDAKLDSIQLETHEQSKALSELVRAETKRSTREGIIFWAVTKGVPMLWAASVAVAGVIAWVATHWK